MQNMREMILSYLTEKRLKKNPSLSHWGISFHQQLIKGINNVEQI